ncbi:hypothetical protein Q0590_08725 [Rhodocytophaga aerolata]|uniref:Uncharacterized protein n=1 Tax=Rhodocytophaga aerolata TaxID=455078 RepID=A0ABT8R2L3_9BACT|nr:hypothetical protein [Rhodocytophaga aerolata]MDO1446332.1 hypothetical protein [Rhodocytophaga aerolata]
MNRITATTFGFALAGYYFAFELIVTRPDIWQASVIMLVIGIVFTLTFL